MTRRWLAVFWLASVVSLAAHQQTTPIIKSARLTAVPELTNDLAFDITNHRETALEHFAIAYDAFGGTVTWHRFRPAEGIAPRTMRTQIVEDHAGKLNPAVPPTFVLLEFADGYYEGTERALQEFFNDRALQARDLAYWIDALQLMPAGLSNAAAAEYVRQMAGEQKKTTGRDSSDAAGRLTGLYDVRRPPGWVAEVFSRSLKEFEEDLRRATRHLDRLRTVGTVNVPAQMGKSVSLQVRLQEGRRIVPVLENLSDVPILAWSLVYRENGGLKGGMMTDTCTSSGVLSSNSIPPHSSRRLGSANLTTSYLNKGASVELGFVLFTDGRSEGDANEIRRLADSRKARALDCSK